jgi:mono/diheme cytochrome c family protein
LTQPLLAAACAAAALSILGAALTERGASGASAVDAAASVAAFERVADVLTSPRCANCHTLTDFPRQGDDRHPHRFNVRRGPDNRGEAAMHCATCHGRANNLASGVPGADEAWRLAPLSMGWEGLSRAELCAHVKDPSLNGGRTGAAIIEHLHTHLVEWAFSPSADAHGRPRTPPPLDYASFVAAAESWIAKGEACPGDAVK